MLLDRNRDISLKCFRYSISFSARVWKALFLFMILSLCQPAVLRVDPERMRWQTEYALYGVDRIIVFSNYIRNQISSRFPKILQSKIIRIYPGADHLGKLKTINHESEIFSVCGST